MGNHTKHLQQTEIQKHMIEGTTYLGKYKLDTDNLTLDLEPARGYRRVLGQPGNHTEEIKNYIQQVISYLINEGFINESLNLKAKILLI